MMRTLLNAQKVVEGNSEKKPWKNIQGYVKRYSKPNAKNLTLRPIELLMMNNRNFKSRVL